MRDAYVVPLDAGHVAFVGVGVNVGDVDVDAAEVLVDAETGNCII